MTAAKRVVRGIVLLATSSLVVCGVKGPPRPSVQTDAGSAASSAAGAGEGTAVSPARAADASAVSPAGGDVSPADGAASADGGRP